jgi:ABC-type antimicrobial peptide transport system permease subunit
MAVGAQSADVAGLVVRQALGMATLGIALGVPVALVSTKVLERFLFVTSPWDPATLVLTAGALWLLAFAASCVPAHRAARVDPLLTLRAE